MAVRGVIPFQVQELIRGPCAYFIPGVLTNENLSDSCDIQLDEEDARRILSAARQHPSLLQQLHQKLGQDRIRIDIYKSQSVGAQMLITALIASNER